MEVTHNETAVVDAWSTSDIVGFIHYKDRASNLYRVFLLRSEDIDT